MEDALVVIPLRNALRTRQAPAGLRVHSDRGGQYVSNELGELIRLWKIRPSMSRGPTTLTTTAPADRPLPSRFGWDRPCGRLKAEMLEGGAFLDVQDAKAEIFDYIEIYYNGTGHPATPRVRRHSSLGYKSPEHFESQYHQNLTSKVCR